MSSNVRGKRIGRSTVRAAAWGVALTALPLGASGCAAGLIGAILGISSIDGSSDAAVDAPPQVTQLETAPQGSRDRILVTFTLKDEDAGSLGAKVRYQEVGSSGAALPATPLPESRPPPDGIERGVPVHFLWDAQKDLDGRFAYVRLLVTPVEDDREGEEFRSPPVPAGNTPVGIDDLVIAAGEDPSAGETIPILLISFTLTDAQSDPATLTALEIGAGDEEPLSLLDPPIAGIPAQLLTSPEGYQSVLKVPLSALDRPDASPALRAAAHPGFRGDLTVRVAVQDFPSEEASEVEHTFLFDNNQPPFVQFLATPSTKLSSGIVPIRYRLFDAESNPADIVVEVDTGDGQGFRPANEFPVPISEGTAALSTLSIAENQGDAAPFHTFLWDAISQAQGTESVAIRIAPRDRELGQPNRDFLELRRTAIQVTEIPTGDKPFSFTSGDYDGDGYPDLLVLNAGSGDVDYLRGGPGGLQPKARISTGDSPYSGASGDFDGDSYCDAAVTNVPSGGLTLLRGNPLGIVRWGDNIRLEAIHSCGSADFDGDGFDDLAVASSTIVTLFLGSEHGLQWETDFEMGRPCFTAGIGFMIGHFHGDSYPDLIVSEQVSNVVTLFRGGSGGLSRSQDIPLVAPPWQFVVADFNRDGHDDILSVNPFDHLFYLEGSERGLSVKKTWVVENIIQFPTVGDFDGDGYPDAAVSRPVRPSTQGFDSLNKVYILRGSGNGLYLKGEVEVDGLASDHLIAGDYDGDGFDDLLVANINSQDVSFLRGGRNGLIPAGNFVGKESEENRALNAISADFDRDGLPEAFFRGPRSIWTYGGVRGGPAQGGLRFTVGTGPRALAAADFDRDGFVDVLTVNTGSDDLTWLRGKPEGFARDAATIPAGKEPVALGIGDLDGNGSLDAVVANRGSNDLSFIPGRPGGFEVDRIRIPAGQEPMKVIVCDLSGDGISEAAAANFASGGVTVLLGRAGGPETLPEIATGAGADAFAAGDLDGDGMNDLAVANHHADNVTVLTGGPQGPSSKGGEVAAGRGPVDILLRDFDGDGLLDLAVADFDGTPGGADGKEVQFFIRYIPGNVSGLATEGRDLRVGSFPAALESADFDGDGFPDLAAANYGSANVSFCRGGVGGLVAAGEPLRVGTKPRALAAADLDGDGYADLSVACENPAAHAGEGGASLLFGGPGGLARREERTCEANPYALCSGDFDGDGITDLAVANAGSGSVSLFGQQYRLPHGNVRIGGTTAGGDGLTEVIDPRNPARYRLEVDGGGPVSPGQVCVVPGEVFELPRAEASSRGKCLAVVADPVSVRRETGADRVPGKVTLLLRTGSLTPAELEGDVTLRIFRQDLGTLEAAPLPLGTQEIAIVDFLGKKGVSFPIATAGTYLVAVERDRPGE